MTMSKEVVELPSMLIQRWRAEAAAHEKRAKELGYGHSLFAHDYEKNAAQKIECAAQLESALSASAEPVVSEYRRGITAAQYALHACADENRQTKVGAFSQSLLNRLMILYANAQPPASCNPTAPAASVPEGAADVRRPNCTRSEPCPACAAAQPAKPAGAVPLARYGFPHGIQDGESPQPMNDGYWTPWHVADLVIAGLREERGAKPVEVSDTTAALIELLRRRDVFGLAKHGKTLDRTDLTTAEWLQHMTEELLDGAGYALAALRTINAAQQPTAEPAVEAFGTVHGQSRVESMIWIRMDADAPDWMTVGNTRVTISPTGGKSDA